LPGSGCQAQQWAPLNAGAVLPGLDPVAVQWQFNVKSHAVFINQIQDRYDTNLQFVGLPHRIKDAAGR
jgi:hypothetical protein